MEFRKWTKRLDKMHLVRTNAEMMEGTLCGKPMLGNNYAKDFPDREPCPECQAKKKEWEEKQ